MVRIYRLDSARDMVDLAKHVQTNIYWGNSFYDKQENEIPYKEFWDHCSSSIDKGFNVVKISEDRFLNDEVEFSIYEGESND